jgi:hypothetical protein
MKPQTERLSLTQSFAYRQFCDNVERMSPEQLADMVRFLWVEHHIYQNSAKAMISASMDKSLGIDKRS